MSRTGKTMGMEHRWAIARGSSGEENDLHGVYKCYWPGHFRWLILRYHFHRSKRRKYAVKKQKPKKQQPDKNTGAV
jgi:hypothetical protein